MAVGSSSAAPGMEMVLGLMSGTSADGVDAAVIVTDGERIGGFGPRLYRPYRAEERQAIRSAMVAARGVANRMDRSGPIAAAERIVTEAHCEVVLKLLREANSTPAGRVSLIGFHGQTLFHAPSRRLTIQIGDAALLAARTGIAVVHDFRAADVAAGGEGAPFVPAYHRALVARSGLDLPVAVVNIGGVANVTWVGPGGELAASDVGPGNALLDDFVSRRTGAPFDRDGALGGAGKVDQEALAELLAHPWFALAAPKSLDRNAFSAAPVERLRDADGAATLTAFTASAVAAGIGLFGSPKRIIVAGGGAHNPVLLKMLAVAAGAPVTTAESAGWSVDFLEAEAFAFLAARSRRGLPLSYPGTTGVPRPMPGGVSTDPPATADSA